MTKSDAAVPSAFALYILLMSSVALAQTATITTVVGTGAAIVPIIQNGAPATAASIPYPFDLDIDGNDNVYFVIGGNDGVSGTTEVYRLSGGTLADVASITNGFGFSYADGVAVTPTGILYVTDYHLGFGRIDKFETSGQTNTGTNTAYGFPMTPPAGLRFKNSQLYVADPGNNRIIRIGLDNNAVTIAGTGLSDVLNFPEAVAIDTSSNVFVADTFNHCIRKISASGTLQTIAGICGSAGFFGDGGQATAAKLNAPGGVAVSPGGVLYIADTGNGRIRRVNANGTIESIAGGGTSLGDGGLATLATLNEPHGLALDSQGRLYVADTGNSRIRMLTFGPTPTAGSPQISENGIVNGASYTAPIAGGEWATIFGQNFTTGPGRLWALSDFVGNTLPTSLDGVRVTFNGKPSAIYFYNANQIDVQVPDGLPDGGVTVAVTTPGGSAIAGVQYTDIAPALFTVAQVTSTTGTTYSYPAAVHADGTLIGRPSIIPGSRPALPGEIVLVFGTGFGPSNPPQASGVLITPSPLPSVMTFTVGASTRNVPTASTLISPGLYQFNITIPAGLTASSDYLLQVGFLAGPLSQVGVYIPVN